MMRSNRLGFTLIELMIVVVIIGILASIAIPAFTQVTRNAKEAEAGPILKKVYTLQERYAARAGSYTMDVNQLEDGASVANAGKYFTYSIIPHATGMCAVATPNALGMTNSLSARSIDANGAFYQSATCT